MQISYISYHIQYPCTVALDKVILQSTVLQKKRARLE